MKLREKWREWLSKIRGLSRPRRDLDDDLQEEVSSHLAFLAEEYLARGLTLEQARAAARREFGNETATRERAREAWRFPGLETVMQDLRSGLRSIRNAPGFSLSVILTLALGIGANTAIFSVIYAVLLRPPPYPRGEQMVQVAEATLGQKLPVTWINFQHWRQENRSFDEMAGFETADLTLTGRGDAAVVHAGVVTASFFRLTGSRPLSGRLFTDADDKPGTPPVVLLTGEYWARMLSSDPNVLGTALTLDGRAYQVIGVLPAGLRFFPQPVDFYLPAGPRDGVTVNRADHGSMLVLGLLKARVKPEIAQADLDAIMHRLAIADPGPENDHRTSATWLAGFGTESIRKTLLMLMGAVGLVLIVACANVASLLLVRSTAKARETAIRSAIGAGRGRLARQLLTENFVLAACGGVAGCLLAGVCLRLLVARAPIDIPRVWEASLNMPVLCFTAAVTMITGLLAGFAPVLSAGRVDLAAALKEGSPTVGAGRRGNALRSALVAAEIAVTLVLTFGCGLLLRSLMLAQTVNPGFRPGGLLALELQLPPSRYKNDDAVRRFYALLLQGLRREPGVVSAGAVNCPPSSACAKGWYSIADLPAPSPANVPLTFLSSVDPEYFQTMGLRLLAGRNFGREDRAGAPLVAIVNEALARHWWPNAPQLAVGHPLKFGGPYMEGPVYRIVGVVTSAIQAGLDTEPFAEVHVAFAQSPSTAMVVMIRTSGDPVRLVPGVRRLSRSIDRNLPIQSLRPFEEWLGTTLDRRRFSVLLLSIFTILVVVLSSVGIYGVLNQWVMDRNKEVAIRLALGAQRSKLLAWIGLHVARIGLFGIALGVIGCYAVSQSLRSMVFGISAHNSAIVAVSVAAVIIIAIFASGVPSWRATRVDVNRNLRNN